MAALPSAELVWFLFSCAVKTTLILGCCAVAVAACRRQSAAWRHGIWLAAFIAVLSVPFAAYWLPDWNVAPHWMVSHNGPQGETASASILSVSSASNAFQPESRSLNTASFPINPFADPPAEPTEPIGASSELASSPDPIVLASGPATASRAAKWPARAVAIWLAGAAAYAIWLGICQVALWHLRRSCTRAYPPALGDLLETTCQNMQFYRPVRLLISQRNGSPMVWGNLRPTMVLPQSALAWSIQRLSAVVAHEMSHLARRDPLVLRLVQLVRLVYWFHPLVWYAAWRLRVERERACDDAVLEMGIDATDYAEHLLHISAAPNAYRLAPQVGLAMSRPHRLEGRLIALLRKDCKRCGPSTTATLLMISLVVILSMPIAALQARANAQAEKGAAVEDASGGSTPIVRLGYVDNTAEGQKSIAGSGHAIEFRRPARARHLMAVEIFASRYGYPDPPAEDFHLYLLDENHRLLHAFPFPYSMIDRGASRWYTLKLPAVKTPKRFHVAFSFNPHQTKGIYLGMDRSVKESHSLIGRPTQGYRPVKDTYDWMIRAVLVEKIPSSNPFDN